MNYNTLYKDKDQGYYSSPRAEILPFVPRNVKTVLDVGCGNGEFGKSLKDNFGFTVWGVEPGIQAALEAQKNLDSIFNTSFNEKLDLGGQKFDCIFFNDVLEHLIEPYDALRFSKSLLNPGGFIISSIPNILHFFTISRIIETQDWQYSNAGILDRTHLRFFTKKSIERMFMECGFHILEIQGINPVYGKRFNLLNLLLLNKIKNMKYEQFITVAKLESLL